MIIGASQVSYVTTHQSESTTVVLDETIARPRRHSHHGDTSARATQTPSADTVQLSSAAAASAGGDDQGLNSLSPKERAAVLVLESLLGHKIKLFHLPSGNAGGSTSPAQGSGEVIHRRTELHSEAEQTTFQAQGVVETADGRQIQFSAQLNMQREFKSASVTTGPAQTADPLMVTFAGTPARVTGAKVAFDLNSDGKQENVSFVANGSGLLALDKNGDGKVNDGRELFGPQTGSGFGELASYDADGNGWIDENDPVFSKLRIWTQDGLSTLSEKGIGAIATSSAETPFTVKDSAGVTQAEVRATGVYLSENGSAGIIQQVDLAEG